MSKIKLGITGYTGRMGQAIMSEVRNFSFLAISVALVKNSNYRSQKSIKLTSSIDELCKLSDIVVDFSSSEIFQKLITSAAKHKIALVSGTTSLKDADFTLLKRTSQKIPVLYSQNMSVGISVLKSLIREVYLKLADKSDVKIVDMHHKNKKDTPSGTAIFLASEMLNKKKVKPYLIKRNLFEISVRPAKKISISSVRSEAMVGQHDIIFTMENENIKISHQALNRNIFATGALKAACWLCKQKSGLYFMQDVLKW